MTQLNSNSLDDDALALARRAAQGEEISRKLLVQRLLPRVRTTVQYLIGQTFDGEDMVQDSLIEILASVGSYSGTGSIEGWADRITVRTTLRALKKQRWYQKRLAEVALWMKHTASSPIVPEDELSRAALRQHMVHVLQKLSDKQRVVIVLRLVYDYRIAEIAETLEVPANTIRERLRVGRAKLRKLTALDPILQEWIKADRS